LILVWTNQLFAMDLCPEGGVQDVVKLSELLPQRGYMTQSGVSTLSFVRDSKKRRRHRVFRPRDRLEAYPTFLPGVSSDDSSAPESTFSYPPRRGDGV